MTDSLLRFAEGPLLRLAFALLVLGLLRLVGLSVWNLAVAYARTDDKSVPVGLLLRRALRWLLPWTYLSGPHPLQGVVAYAFHVGLLAVPLFFAGHVALWRERVGIGWPALPAAAADILTWLTIACAAALMALRAARPAARAVSDWRDYFWLALLGFAFLTGFLAAHPAFAPVGYKTVRLAHVLSADVILASIPFSKLAHCVLIPFTHFMADLAWRFPPDAGDAAAAALGKEDEPI